MTRLLKPRGSLTQFAEQRRRQRENVNAGLQCGDPVKLPGACNAVEAITPTGRVARVLASDVDTLRGTVWASATAGVVKFTKTGGVDWDSFKASYAPIELRPNEKLTQPRPE